MNRDEKTPGALNTEERIRTLTASLLSTRAELDALRTVCMGVISALADAPGIGDRLPGALKHVIETDFAWALNSPVPDHIIEQRTAWQQLLVPQALRAGVWQEDNGIPKDVARS